MAPQSYEPKFFLLKRRLPASESANLLGRVVQRYQDPTRDFTPDSPAGSVTAEVFKTFLLGVQYDTDAILKAHAARNDGFRAKLSGLLSFSADSAEGGSTTVESPRVITRRLKLEKDYFDALKAVPDVRRKILEMCPVGDKVYLIVGTMSAQTAKFEQTAAQTTGTSVSGSLQLPLSVAMSVGAMPHLDTVTSPEAGTNHSESSGWSMKFSSTAIGEDGNSGEAEEVFAVACREISRSWRDLGQDVKMKTKPPEYRGGQHFGAEEDSDSADEDDANEEMEAFAAGGLHLLEDESTRVLDGLWISGP
jgi:hypothetical protein